MKSVSLAFFAFLILLAAHAGATDLIFKNQNMWFQVNQDTTQTTYFVMNAGGVAGRPSLIEKWVCETLIDKLVPDFKIRAIDSIASDPRAARITQRFDITAGEKKLRTDTTFELPDNSKYALFTIRYTNTGDRPLTFSEPDHNVGRGHIVLHIGFLEQHDVACTVNGIGNVDLATMGTFMNMGGVNINAPYATMTNKKTNESATFGFVGPQPHPINHIMAANGSIFTQSNIYLYTDEYTLGPGESETYTGIIAFHPGGADEGASIYNEAAKKAGAGIEFTSPPPAATPKPTQPDPFNPFP